MNLIDFEVTKIISERRDKVWKLAGYTEKGLKRSQMISKYYCIFYKSILRLQKSRF
mgnify:CR=1 FL=1